VVVLEAPRLRVERAISVWRVCAMMGLSVFT
jgi:hypothetical protein